MSTSTPSPRRVMSASNKTNRNGAVATGASSKSVSTLSKGSHSSLQTLNPNPNSKLAKSENILSTTDNSVADVNGNPPAAVPALNLNPWKDGPGTIGTLKSKSKMSASKIPLRATCEDVFDDEALPNTLISASAITKAISKPKNTAGAMYRDMPAGDVDMNPKSPKSPKTKQSPKMKIPVEQRVAAKKKKSKKKKSKDVPPAKIRSPTLEEKQARLAETFKLYDNPFQKQYEKIKEMHLMARQTGTKAEQDAKLIADIRMYQQLDPDNVPANNFIDSFEQLVGRSHARVEANRDKPITEFLQKQPAVKVDVDGAAVGRAQDFWAEPNEILSDAGKNLNNTFKAALDRAAGAKINTMVVGGSGGVGTYQAGTVFGAKADKGLTRPVLETKESETIAKLREKVADPTIDPEKNAIATNEDHRIKERVVDIMALAIEISQNSEELDANMHDLFPKLTIHSCWVTDSITAKLGAHPRLLLNHGSYGTTMASCVNYIIDEVYPMFSTCRISDDERALAWCEFITSAVKLWTLTDQQLKQLKLEYTKTTGFQMMNVLVVESLQGLMKRKQGLSGQFDIMMLTNATIWFVEEFCWTGGDLRVVVSLAEKTLPSKETLFETLNGENGWKLLGHPGRDAFIKGLDLDFGEIRTLLEALKENKTAMEAYSRLVKSAKSKKPETPACSRTQSPINKPDGKAKSQLSDYGRTIPEVIGYMQFIIDDICEPKATTSEEQAAAQRDFLHCGIALWGLVDTGMTPEERDTQKGLGLMAQTIWHAVIKETVPRDAKVTIMQIYTSWFIHEWTKAGGDIEVVKEKALKAMPTEQANVNARAAREGGQSGLPSGSSKAPPALSPPVKTELQRATPKIPSEQPPTTSPKAIPKKPTVPAPPTYSQTPISTPKGGLFEPTDDTLSMLLAYGRDIPQAISRMEIILGTLSETNPATLEYKIVSDDCIECSCALWYHIQAMAKPLQSEKKVKTGLELLCFAILSSLNDGSMSHFLRMQLYIKCSVWFMVQWKKNGGDFEKVREEALKELPTGTEDLRHFPRFSKSALGSELVAAMVAEGSTIITTSKASESRYVNGTASSAATIPRKAVPSKAVAEANFEIPAVKKHVEAGDHEEFDVTHESMEYIEPSALTTSSFSLKPVPEVKIAQVNAGTDSLHSKQAASSLASLTSYNPATPVEKSSPITNNNNNSQEQDETHKQTHHQIDTDDDSDNMPNNMAPPTPPMSSEELDAHASPVSDLHIIHDTLIVLSQSLYQITTALYGIYPSQKTSVNTDTDTDTESRTELSAGVGKAGLLVITDRLSEWLKDAQSEIAAVDSKVRDLDSKIDGLRRDNRELKVLVEGLVGKVGRRGGDEMLRGLLAEVGGLKGEVERLAERGEKEGEGESQSEKESGNAIWLEKVRDLQGVVERAREVGGLREVLWPQGDGGLSLGVGVDLDCARPGVKSEGVGVGEAEREKGGRRELYVNVGNQAGRGQGGGGFCGVM